MIKPAKGEGLYYMLYKLYRILCRQADGERASNGSNGELRERTQHQLLIVI